MRTSVLVDCTATVTSGLNTGIQRVVRKVATEAVERSFGETEFVPAVRVTQTDRGACFYRLDREEIGGRPLPGSVVKTAQYARKTDKYRNSKSAFGAVKYALYSALRDYHWRRFVGHADGRKRTVGLDDVDAILMLDATWQHDTGWIARRPSYCRLVTVVYDILPVTHPQFFNTSLTLQFEQNYVPLLRQSDALISISRMTMHELRQLGLAGARDFFHLGCDPVPTSRSVTAAAIAQKYRQPFEGSAKVFLSVGTIEPRKGYDLTLSAFEQLWRQGFDGRLVILGKYGWKSEDTAARIKASPFLNRQLFWFEDASDEVLVYSYQNACALVFASSCEGYGLPLTEALNAGLPVLASDIPVFREIGGDHVQYFQLTADALAEALATYSREEWKARVRTYKPRTWSESAVELLGKVAEFLRAPAMASIRTETTD